MPNKIKRGDVGHTAALLVQAGTHTVVQAAEEIGCSRQAVYSAMSRLNVPPPRGVRSETVVLSNLIMPEPDRMQVKAARLQAGLTLRAATTLVGGTDSSRIWMNYESGTRQMGSDRWTLFLLATDQHPAFRIYGK